VCVKSINVSIHKNKSYIKKIIIIIIIKYPESTHTVQTSAKEYVSACNVKLLHNIEIRLITKIVGT